MNASVLRHCGNTFGRFQNSSTNTPIVTMKWACRSRCSEPDEPAGRAGSKPWIDLLVEEPERSVSMLDDLLGVVERLVGRRVAAGEAEPNWLRVQE